MTDCLIIGYNAMNFGNYVDMLKSMGTNTGNCRDLRLHYIEHEGRPYRSMDILNHIIQEKDPDNEYKPLHNADFVWPVILYLGSYLANRGMTFDYINLYHFDKERLKEKLLKQDALTIAITTTLYVTPHPIIEIISFIRKYNKTAKIIVGGPYIVNSSAGSQHLGEFQTILKFIDADFFVINSEGELALFNIIQALKNGTGFLEIDNIAFKDGKGYVFTHASEENNLLAENPVNYGLFPKEELGEFISLRTSKSCPFACSYCGFHIRAGKYRYMAPEDIERELDKIKRIGSVTTLTFIDDTLNMPKQRFKDLLKLMIRKKYDFKWNCFYRCDFGDDETIELMKEAGCEGVFLGVESGNEKVLKIMNKGLRPGDVLKAMPKFREMGILTYSSYIIGFPGETRESVQDTIDLIEESKSDFCSAQLWYCDPITPIYQKKEEYGIKGAAFSWSHNTMDWTTACSLLENAYLTVQNSVWLPFDGFAYWSVFYLMRKGLSITQIKNFLRCFKAVVEDQLLNPNRKNIAPRLYENLRKSCDFDILRQKQRKVGDLHD